MSLEFLGDRSKLNSSRTNKKRRSEQVIPIARPEIFTMENILFFQRFLKAILKWLVNIDEALGLNE
jgi:hypothetical protein